MVSFGPAVIEPTTPMSSLSPGPLQQPSSVPKNENCGLPINDSATLSLRKNLYPASMPTVPPTERPPDSVDPKLLEILVCPLTKGPLEYDATKQELISRKAKLAYPIRDGIPIMLPEEARRLE